MAMTVNNNVYRADFVWLFTAPEFWESYHNSNNDRDSNYLFWRRNVKDREQDVYVLIKTSQHCWALSHYRALDGFGELKRFVKLHDATDYLLESKREYDELYAKYKEAERAKKEAKKAALAEKKARRALKK